MTVIGIVGLGLIGGSFALAAERAGHSVQCWDRDESTQALARDAGLTVSTDFATVELVVLAAPMPALTGGLSDLLAGLDLPESATITDVGSLKQPVQVAMTHAGLAGRYVGGHPMAGTEGSGFEAADADLFAGARWALCLRGTESDLTRWLNVASVLTDLGASIVAMTPAEHDTAMAVVSGVPHLLALALSTSADVGGPLVAALAAGSFADLTRVSASSPTLLRAVTTANEPAVRAALDSVLRQLERPWSQLIEDGHAARRRLRGEAQSGSRRLTESRVASASDLLALGRQGAVIEAVDPDHAAIRYRRPDPA